MMKTETDGMKIICFALALIFVSAFSFAAEIPTDLQWGVTFGFHAKNGYFSSEKARDEVEAMAKAGATWVTVVPTVWQDSCHSTFQYRDFIYTPNDIELLDIIDFISKRALLKKVPFTLKSFYGFKNKLP